MPKLLGWDKQRIAARVDELLELVSLDPAETRDRYPAQLSGGQRQRVGVARALAVDPPLMLMDEPFGAIDPINRERLQNEFLRLQKEIRKTIVFVTHDIDEAIKIGDKIAVLQKGGKLAQFANPAELLMYPASEFVEEFVGADRALKRLALQRVRDIDLWKVAQVRVGEMSADAPAQGRGRRPQDPRAGHRRPGPAARLARRERPERRARARLRQPGATVEMDDILRDALSDLLTSEARYGVVVDDKGVVQGVLSIEVISRFLHEAPTDSRSGADLVEDTGRVNPADVFGLFAQLQTRNRAGRGHLRVRGRLLPRLDRRQLAALPGPVLGARVPDARVRGRRLRRSPSRWP